MLSDALKFRKGLYVRSTPLCSFSSKKFGEKYAAKDRFHGKGKIPSKKEPVRTLGFTSRRACHIITTLIIWLAPRAGKMKRILCFDFDPERAR